MEKKCNTCNLMKNENEFFVRDKTKNKRHGSCKACYKHSRKDTYKQHYEKNKSEYINRAKSRKEKILSENRINMFNLLSNSSCKDCGETNPIVMEFDHLSDKQYNISRMMQDHFWERILEEISKCEIVCCNCHRIRTSKRGNWYRTIRNGSASEIRTRIDGDLQSPV